MARHRARSRGTRSECDAVGRFFGCGRGALPIDRRCGSQRAHPRVDVARSPAAPTRERGRLRRSATNSARTRSCEVNYAVTTHRPAESVAFHATLLHFCGNFLTLSTANPSRARARR
ncbi:hypothetical protein WJ16_23880 [Burkholderia metallica]|nr:hypothetical protein WJ16_23880 [Burkholderia metallica]